MTDRSAIRHTLVAARKRIEKKEGWCQGYHFVAENGEELFWDEEAPMIPSEVKCCCADGAIILECGSGFSSLYNETCNIMLESSQNLFNIRSYAKVNDGYNTDEALSPENIAPDQAHANILKVFDDAICRISEDAP